MWSTRTRADPDLSSGVDLLILPSRKGAPMSRNPPELKRWEIIAWAPLVIALLIWAKWSNLRDQQRRSRDRG